MLALSSEVWWQKLAKLEKGFQTIQQEHCNTNGWFQRHGQLGDWLNKMSQMNVSMKNTIDETEKASKSKVLHT